MGLKMLEPWKNPRSKNYWFRRRIPKQYLGYFAGRTEIKISLGTADYNEIRVCARIDGSFYLGDHFARRNQILSFEVTALLWQ